MQPGNENLDVFRTPSRRKEPSLFDIVRQDNVSPLKSRTLNTSVHVATPMPQSNSKNRSSVAELFGSRPISTSKNNPVVPMATDAMETDQPTAPVPAPVSAPLSAPLSAPVSAPAPVSAAPSSFDFSRQQGIAAMQGDMAVLKAELEKERKARHEASEQLMKMTKARISLELDLQKREESIKKLEGSLREEKTSFSISKLKFDESEQIIKSQLAKETEKRRRLEEELSHKEKQLTEQQQKLQETSSEAQQSKKALEDSQQVISNKEKQLSEKEKARQRRSMGFHEEQKARIQLEDEIDTLQIAYDDLKEQYEDIVSSMESQLSVEKERYQLLTSKNDLTQKELAQEKEKNQALNLFSQDLRNQVLFLTKTLEESQNQLTISHQALTILQQRFDIDTKRTEKQLSMTADQLEIVKLAERQASIGLNLSSNIVANEKKVRLGIEEKLAVEQKFKADLEQQLELQRTEVIPLMQHQLQTNQEKINELGRQLSELLQRNELLEQELLAERKLRLDSSEALMHQIDENRTLEKILGETQEKMEKEIKKEKAARFKVEQDLSIQMSHNRQLY